ncbi:polysaccharide deacetylase family protein [Pedococcus sp. NPDC057267]|uniref:polysaccharide deacetylase family protein n=1 Tax=Pedococcus sp. NPDC057267 TaxID=3346077 RepID=UPI00363985D8
MNRRGLLAVLAAGVTAGLTACSEPGAQSRALPSRALPSPQQSVTEVATPSTTTGVAAPPFTAPVAITKVPVPFGTLYRLPGTTDHVALTIDDGTDEAVLAAYARLARDTGLRLTFFCNGINPSWTEHADLLRPLVDDNQVFIANHTWSHPNLTTLSQHRIAEEVQRNERFLRHTYGISGRPFLRPPFGFHNPRVDAQLAALGYPAVTLWWGSLGDATVETPAAIIANATAWLLPGRIVIGHANHPPVMKVYGQLVEIIRSRRLQPVHLGDVFEV